jgi:hypothetical protein
MELRGGDTVKTEANAEAYLQVNGFTSTIKITENTILELTKMDCKIGGDTETVLTVKKGKILSSVRKLSANSSYVIHTPKGVASIRGTDFEIAADLLPDGAYRVTFTSVTGQVSVTAMVDGQEKTQNLTTGQSWTPGRRGPEEQSAFYFRPYAPLAPYEPNSDSLFATQHPTLQRRRPSQHRRGHRPQSLCSSVSAAASHSSLSLL